MLIKKLKYKSYEEFYKKWLVPNTNFNNFLKRSICRGQENSKFKLIPQLFRENYIKKSPFFPKFLPQVDLFEIEYSLLSDFYNTCNKNGLDLSYIKYLSNGSGYNLLLKEFPKLVWPPHDIYEFISLAQHSGLPTRLLDWSYDINVALYFACRGILKLLYEEKDFPKMFSIFILDTYILDTLTNENSDMKLKILRPIYTRNKNIHSQMGLFTVIETEYMKVDDEFVQIGLNPDSIEDYLKVNFNMKSIDPLLYKISIPSIEAPKIMSDLYHKNYTYGKLFPGYSSSVKELEEYEIICSLL